MKKYFYIGVIILFAACSKEVVLDLPPPEDKIVVEGQIENGQPPLVMLTKNQAYFSKVDLSDFENIFIKNASVNIEVDGQTFPLIELTIPLSPTQNISIYTTFSLIGEIGKKYTLNIVAENKTLRAETIIPNPVVLDSLYWLPHPGVATGNDSLALLMAVFKDPDTVGNYYRFFTKRNSEDFKAGYFASVFDDLVFNGSKFDVPFERGMYRTEEFDPNTYSYFWKGDTVSLKLSSIDKSAFDFWRTLEQDIGSNGNPFGIPTKIKTNIEGGGLGVWCGYGASIDTVIIID